MKKHYLYLLLVLAFTSLLTTNCTKQELNDDYPSSDSRLLQSSVPYADSAELQQFAGDAQIVDYKLARKLALIQLYTSDRIKTQKWENYKLSERPVVVYGFDNKPMFYDFFMCDASAVEKATVSVNARKSASVIIKTFGNHVDNYATTKSGGQQLYADFAGVRYRGAATKSGNINSAVNLSTGEVVNNLEPLNDDQMMLLMETELLPQMYQDPELLAHHLSAMKQRLADHKAKSQAMWSFVAQNQTFVDTVSDVGIALMRIGDLPNGFDDEGNGGSGGGTPGGSGGGGGTPSWMADIQYGPEDIAYLKNFENKHQSQERDGWCGPWVISYILESAYGGESNAVFNEEGAMDAGRFNQDLKYYSNDRCSIDLSGSSEWEAYWDVRQKATCSLRLTAVGGYHWTCIYGAKRDEEWSGATSYYFLQADNGALIRTPWNSVYRDPMNQYSYEDIYWYDTVFSVNINR